MNLDGTHVARTARMRERSLSASSNASLLMQPALVESEPSAPIVEKDERTENEELDKYDISTLACTD